MAAHLAMHTRNDSGVSIHSFIRIENPPSPTLTNPDMIVPVPPWENDPDFNDDDEEGPHPLLEPEILLSDSKSTSSLSRESTTSADQLSVATALVMPQRLSIPPPTTLNGPGTPIPTYTGYEHGAPLSDIYEESEATPRSIAVRSRSASPTPTPDQPPTPTRPHLRHKKRMSELSLSSGGSDVGDWENYDSSKVLTSRVAADLAQMKREETLDVEEQTSRRQSREEEELAALNAKAEKILANARKRLTHMEDNLKTARNSILGPRSPSIGDSHQPVGGLYRSISAAGATKLAKQRQAYPSIRTSTSLQHMRGSSETGLASPNKRISRLPDVRSASALEYGSPARYSLFPETNQSPASKYQPSPTSIKSYNSPLRPLEEERTSPSTAKTTPESVKIPPMRGLGILTTAAMSREATAIHPERSSSRQNSTPTPVYRPDSAASTRSAKDLKDQMIDLKTRIADLRSKTAADTLRRRSLQGTRGSSPYTNSPNQAEQWYASSPTYDGDSPISARGGVGWKNPESPTQVQTGPIDEPNDDPVTPANARFLDVNHLTPNTEAHMLSSARTDRNTPSLARKRNIVDEDPEDEDDAGSVIQASQYDEVRNNMDNLDDDEEAERVAENEEEQVYLNEVLEESLRDAEVEPEVPMIPGGFLPSPDGIVIGPEPERHEDRLDAFDYENMFLHSAMGTYTGKSLNGSESASETESEDDDGSVETSRAGGRTPVDESEPDTEPPTDEEMEQLVGEGKTHVLESQRTPQNEQQAFQPKQLHTPPQIALPPTPAALSHARSKSMDSISTAATFETATEGGDHYDDTPTEILNWGPTPSSSVGYSPTSYQAYRTSETRPPARHRHGFSSPQGGGRSTSITSRLTTMSTSSPLRQQFVATEAVNHINDNGVPERFQNQPSPYHSSNSTSHKRNDSASTVQPGLRHSSQSAIKYGSPIRDATPTTPEGRTSKATIDGHSPPTGRMVSSPQRKTVINRSLQHPESYVAEPYYAPLPYAPLPYAPPPSAPLPAPPTLLSSATLQAQMASPKRSALKQSPGTEKARPTSALKKSSPTTSIQQQRTPPRDPPRDPPSSPPTAGPIPNTEILMESLIKLANPDFSLAPGIRFSEVDKHLVLDLLGAVGSVCNEILTAGRRRADPEETVENMRGRLEVARDTLFGYRDVRGGDKTMREI